VRFFLVALISIFFSTCAYPQSGGFPSRPTFGKVNVTVPATASLLTLRESDGGANAKSWSVNTSTTQLSLSLDTDAGVNTTFPLIFTRSGTTATQIDLAATALKVNTIDVTPSQGTFSLTLSTGCTTTPSVTATYQKVGQMVTMHIPFVTCTSNSSQFQFSGIPAAIRPSTATGAVAMANCLDNTTNANNCSIRVNTSGTADMLFNDQSASWTTSGTKALDKSAIFTYLQF